MACGLGLNDGVALEEVETNNWLYGSFGSGDFK